MRFQRYALWGSIDQNGPISLSVLPQDVMPYRSSGYVAELTPPLPLAVAEGLKQRVMPEIDRSVGARNDGAGRSLTIRHIWPRRAKPDPAQSLLRLRRQIRSVMVHSGVFDLLDAGQPDGHMGSWAVRGKRPHRPLRGPLQCEQHSNSEQGSSSHGSALISTRSEIKDHVFKVLTGRLLLTRELGQALTQQGVTVFDTLDELLAPWVDDGAIQRWPAIHGRYEVAGWRWQCTRCTSGQIRLVACHRCGWAACARCLSCDSLGASTACSALYHRASEPSRAPKSVRVELPFSLTQSQQRLAQDLVKSDRDALIWAACGSGKTEAVLETMRATLAAGGRVLFALPRRDVVTQLGERLQDAIVGVRTVTLSGDTPDKYATAPLIVSTVHQAVRFQHAFDLVVVDEVDAFPLNQEPWLLAALIRAKRPGGRVVMMTATPSDALKNRVDVGHIEAHTLPGRPHGHPLPVPKVVIDAAVSQDNVYRAMQRPVPQRSGLSQTARTRPDAGETVGTQYPKWVTVLGAIVEESVTRGRRMLVFVPSVRLCETVLNGLSAYAVSAAGGENDNFRWQLDQVHAGDPERTQKIDAFSRGELHALISTSILERGITLAYLDVVVFMADSENLFDAATLIQMAGRAGRRVEDPTGDVIFLAANRTPAMDDAISTIQRLNALAQSSS